MGEKKRRVEKRMKRIREKGDEDEDENTGKLKKMRLSYEEQMERDIVQLILNHGNMEWILTMVFAKLRNKPLTLIKYYNIIGKTIHDKDFIMEIDEDERKLDEPNVKINTLQNFVNMTFKNLWFISFKECFPKEMMNLYEFDYISKNQIKHFNDFYNEDQNWVYPIAPLISKILGIDYYDKNNYYQNLFGILRRVDFPHTAYDLVYRTKYNLSDLWFDQKGKKPNNIFICHDHQWYGYNLKIRRIFYLLVDYLLTHLSRLYTEIKLLIVNESKGTQKQIMKNVSESLTYIMEKYIEDIKDYTKNNQSRDKNKRDYFDFFLNFKVSFEVLISELVKITAHLQQRLSNRFSYFYNKLNSILDEVIQRVENEIKIDDKMNCDQMFLDTEDDDNLVISLKKFKWFYTTDSYDRNTEKMVIRDMTREEIKERELKLSKQWFKRIYARLDKMSTEEKLTYKNRITIQ
jgi:hypothetical protein